MSPAAVCPPAVTALSSDHRAFLLPTVGYSPQRRKLTAKDPQAGVLAEGYGLIDGGWYAEQVAGLRENPGCVGAHLCGAFMRNRQRRVGLLDEEENEDLEATTKIAACNSETEEWVAGLVVQ